MDNEILNQLFEMFRKELQAELEPITKDIKEINSALNSLKEQFKDFEDKTGTI